MIVDYIIQNRAKGGITPFVVLAKEERENGIKGKISIYIFHKTVFN